jgi:HSP20 family protein
MLTLRDTFFDLLDRSFDDFPSYTGQREPESRFSSFVPEVESYQKDNNLMFRMAIPGVDPKDVDVSIQDRYISIKAERQRPVDVKEEDWHLRGFGYGRIERTWTLPESVDLNKIEANFNNGVLEIRMPAAEKLLPKKIEVKQLKLAA